MWAILNEHELVTLQEQLKEVLLVWIVKLEFIYFSSKGNMQTNLYTCNIEYLLS